MTATVWSALSDPWSEPILRRAFLEMALIGVAGGALGCWVVYYRLAYASESLAHALLPGLVVAALTGLPLLLGGAVGLVVAAVGVAVAGLMPTIGRDTAVAVVVTALFGLGALLALSPASPPGLQGILFGDPLGASDGDLALAGALVVVVAITLAGLHRQLLVVGFDRVNARSLGASPARVDVALLVLLAALLLVAVQGLGNLLVVAILIAPASAARLLTRRIATMLVLSAGIAVAGGAAGLYVSYHLHTAAGASIAGALVAAAAAVSLGRGAARVYDSARQARQRPRSVTS